MEQMRRLVQQQKPDEHAWPLVESLPAGPSPESGGDGAVTVISGASLQALPLAGLSVSQARDLAGTILNIDPQCPVLVNGRRASAGYRLAGGDTLEFVHRAGEKGGERRGPSS